MLDSVAVDMEIQIYRVKYRLSQEVVSGLADIGRTHLSAIERGVMCSWSLDLIIPIY